MQKIIITTGLVCLCILVAGILFQWYTTPRRYSVITTTPQSSNTATSTSFFAPHDAVYPTPQPIQAITSIDQVFGKQPVPDSANTTITLVATGDVLLARSINYKMRQLNNFNWPFLEVAPLLQSGDITYINLETPLVQDCPSKVDGMVFCGDPRGTEGLRYAGVDVVNIANNHAANYGLEGVIETENTLKNQNFIVSGRSDNNAGFMTVKNTRFAFLGYNEVNEQAGVTASVEQTIQTEIAEAKTQADIVIVQFHWGNEYTYKPSEHQKYLARVAIDAGADLIIGNHPHWYQPIEFYKDKLITYSHGNLVFDQMWSRETRVGIVGQYVFQDKKLVLVRFVPVLIENYGQPRIMDTEEGQKVIDTLKNESFLLKSTQ